MPPYQVQNFNAASMNPFDYFHEFQSTNQNITHGNDRIITGLNDSTQYLTANVNTVSKDLNAATLGLRDAIERGNLINGNAIERTSGDIKLNSTILDAANRQAANDSIRDVLRAVDANGNVNSATTERVGSNLNSTTERVGSNLNSTVERTAAQIERLAGEGRLTTTVTDAASRQAANDGVRDVIRSIAATDVSVERTAGETRSNFLSGLASQSALVADTRKTITEGINRSTNELIGVINSNATNMSDLFNINAAENRTASNIAMMEQVRSSANIAQQNATNHGINLLEQQKIGSLLAAQGARSFADMMLEQQKSTAVLSHEGTKQYADIMLEQQKAAAVLSSQGARSYSDLMLEQQKTTAVLAHEGSSHHASLLLEQQRLKEYLSSKGDSHFAMNQLEMQKVKEGLAFQAAQNFASLQLESAKTSGLISAQLAEAKYDALKNTQFLADKMGDCCCEVKMKIDNVDRDRLRDNLIVERVEHHEDHHRRGRDDHHHHFYDRFYGRDGRDGRDGRGEEREEGRGGRGGGEGGRGGRD